MTKWCPGTITQDISKQIVEVDGMPCHVKHIRPRSGPQNTQMERMVDVEIEVNDSEVRNDKDVAHFENSQNVESDTVTGSIADHSTVDSKIHNTVAPLRRSNRERRLPLKLSEDCCPWRM